MGRKRLTNEDLDKRLINRNIKRIGEYIDAKTPIKFECLIKYCGKKWDAYPANISSGTGCPDCAIHSLRLTNEIVDFRLSNRKIQRLNDYVDCESIMEFKCLVCNLNWKTKTAIVITMERGCPHCGGSIKMTNNTFDAKIIGRKIKRLDDYKGNKVKIYFKCLEDNCNHTWQAKPCDILNKFSGCPKCAGLMPLTNEIIDERLKLSGKSIFRIGDYNSIHIPIKFGCSIINCDYKWDATPHHIMSENAFCPKCSNFFNLKLTNEIIDFRLANRPIKRSEDCSSATIKIKFKCLIDHCGVEWNASPNNILNNGGGCPNHNNSTEFSIYKIISDAFNVQRHKYIKQILPNEPKRLFVDIYIPSKNIIIEYNGGQHYRPVTFGGCSKEQAMVNFEKQKERDLYLQKICDENNIKLISINGDKFKGVNLFNYINNEIISEINNHPNIV